VLTAAEAKGKVMNIREHLISTRDDLVQIEALTRNLRNEPSFEEIESILRRRDLLVVRMKDNEHQLSLEDARWNERAGTDPVQKSLLDESKSLLRSVADIDSRLSMLIESRMRGVRQQLLSLYHTSRAAYSYIYHSCYRAAR
jgi:hypothetical protein